jgi:hypothetical protein
MEILNLSNIELTELSNQEMSIIDAGHKGIAYSIGHAVGESIQVASCILGLVAFILAPKS